MFTVHGCSGLAGKALPRAAFQAPLSYSGIGGHPGPAFFMADDRNSQASGSTRCLVRPELRTPTVYFAPIPQAKARHKTKSNLRLVRKHSCVPDIAIWISKRLLKISMSKPRFRSVPQNLLLLPSSLRQIMAVESFRCPNT